MKHIAVLSAHPDDETLGCGGTILRHVAEGDRVSWVIATQGWEPRYEAAMLKTKTAEIERVADAYGMTDVVRLGLPTTRLRELPAAQLIDGLASAIDRLAPDWIYTVHAGDVHTDHRAVVEALSIVCKPFRARPRIARLLSFETLSSTEAAMGGLGPRFDPQVFVDIGPYVSRKIEIMELFASEQQPYPGPRSAESIRALARYRGAAIGCEHAEAFMLLREIRD
jgi:LmbE family N-acetylglucosaminyl deacetylase